MVPEPVSSYVDYPRETVERSRSVLLELAALLGDYRDGLVLVGGWVPALLLERHQPPGISFQHIGSADVDFLVDPEKLPEDRYATVAKLLEERGYARSDRSVFTFQRSVPGLPKPIGVDFLVPAPAAGAGRRRETPEVQPGLRARTVEGADVALRHRSTWSLEGALPDGGRVRAEFLMADIAGILAMKGIAFGLRLKGRGKDAYDIWSLCRYYGAGPKEVGRLVREAKADPGIQQGLAVIQERFSSPDAVGPAEVARFLADGLPEGILEPRLTSFQDVQAMLEAALT